MKATSGQQLCVCVCVCNTANKQQVSQSAAKSWQKRASWRERETSAHFERWTKSRHQLSFILEEKQKKQKKKKN